MGKPLKDCYCSKISQIRLGFLYPYYPSSLSIIKNIIRPKIISIGQLKTALKNIAMKPAIPANDAKIIAIPTSTKKSNIPNHMIKQTGQVIILTKKQL
jgi:hypothetical protein